MNGVMGVINELDVWRCGWLVYGSSKAMAFFRDKERARWTDTLFAVCMHQSGVCLGTRTNALRSCIPSKGVVGILFLSLLFLFSLVKTLCDIQCEDVNIYIYIYMCVCVCVCVFYKSEVNEINEINNARNNTR